MYSFFVTYARLAGWTPKAGIDDVIAAAPAWPAMDHWILSRAAGLAGEVAKDLGDYDAVDATREISTFIDDLSTWYLRRSRDRMRAGADPADRDAAFATLHAALVTLARTLAPILPFLAESMYQNLMVTVVPGTADSVHLTSWPADDMAAHRDPDLERRDGHGPRCGRSRPDASGAGGPAQSPAVGARLARPAGSRHRHLR